ncbi:sialidase family protein [Longispora sp. K20-0274]|uniref:hypothetical protein n=1 Tax=Longispora sp. K20-0274 TaxID=3088255 RepID=UPI00399C2BF3
MPELLDPFEPDDRIERALAESRSHLLGNIPQPGLGSVSARADAVRRRRRLFTAAGGTALAVLTITGVRLASAPAEPQPGPAAPNNYTMNTTLTSHTSTWAGEGIEVLAPDRPTLNVPGSLYDVEFADDRHGYALAADCRALPTCTLTFARSDDGGDEWQTLAAPIATATPETLPDLVVLNGTELVLGGSWHSPDSGRTWAATPVDDAPLAAIPANGRLFVAGDGLRVRLAGAGGRAAKLTTVPAGLTVRWAAAGPARDGAWWITGTSDGKPQIAVSRDAGRTWLTTTLSVLNGDIGNIRIATGKDQIYAVVTGRATIDGTHQAGSPILGLFRSTDNGQTFALFEGFPPAAAEDTVPLPDGRVLMAVDTDPGTWWVAASGQQGGSKITALPQVSRVHRTGAGYVAFGVWGMDWAAFSPDGMSWRRLGLR